MWCVFLNFSTTFPPPHINCHSPIHCANNTGRRMHLTDPCSCLVCATSGLVTDAHSWSWRALDGGALGMILKYFSIWCLYKQIKNTIFAQFLWNIVLIQILAIFSLQYDQISLEVSFNAITLIIYNYVVIIFVKYIIECNKFVFLLFSLAS